MGKVYLLKDLKTFLFIWAAILLVLSVSPLYSNEEINYIALAFSFISLLLAIFKAELIRPIYSIWMKLSEFMGSIISKVIMLVLFFVIFTPISFMLKLLGKDFLNKKIKKDTQTYWLDREIKPGSMKNQF